LRFVSIGSPSNKSFAEAAQIAIGKIGKLGGVVGIDKNGNIMHFYNTEGMYRGRVGVEGKMIIEIYEK
jgi:beta-aspartyl-peptidase (threonine type)